MNFLKNNKKLIAGFAAGAIIFSGIGYAANEYLAGDIRYTKSGASSSITVAQALNELYEMKDNKYTTEEYSNYGNQKYTEGLNANEDILSNAKGYKTGIYTCKTNKEKKWIDCGFRPRYVVISFETVGEFGNTAMFMYKDEVSTTDSYMTQLGWTGGSVTMYTMEGKNGTIAGDALRHIYGVDDTGFGFYFNVSDRTIYYTAFR